MKIGGQLEGTATNILTLKKKVSFYKAMAGAGKKAKKEAQDEKVEKKGWTNNFAGKKQ